MSIVTENVREFSDSVMYYFFWKRTIQENIYKWTRFVKSTNISFMNNSRYTVFDTCKQSWQISTSLPAATAVMREAYVTVCRVDSVFQM